MGIQSLLPTLKSVAQPRHIRDYRGQRVVVDGYSWLHKGAYTCAKDLCEGVYTDRFVTFCVSRVELLRQHGLSVTVVLDGGRLPMKADEEDSRRKSRRDNLERARAHQLAGNVSAAEDCYQKAVSITSSMAKQLIEALKDIGVSYIVAPYEADAQMAYLAHTGEAHAVITEDSDLLAYGCPRVFYKMDRAGHGEEICLADLPRNKGLSFVGFDHRMFLEMCIMAGCDFLPNLPGIGVKKAHAHLKKLRSFVKVVKSLRFSGVPVPRDYEVRFQMVLWVFRHQLVFCPQRRMCVHVRPLPPGGLGAADVDVPAAVPRRGQTGVGGQRQAPGSSSTATGVSGAAAAAAAAAVATGAVTTGAAAAVTTVAAVTAAGDEANSTGAQQQTETNAQQSEANAAADEEREVQDLLSFLGPMMPPDIAAGVAKGDLQPSTKQPYDLAQIYEGCPLHRMPQGVQRQLVGTATNPTTASTSTHTLHPQPQHPWQAPNVRHPLLRGLTAPARDTAAANQQQQNQQQQGLFNLGGVPSTAHPINPAALSHLSGGLRGPPSGSSGVHRAKSAGSEPSQSKAGGSKQGPLPGLLRAMTQQQVQQQHERMQVHSVRAITAPFVAPRLNGVQKGKVNAGREGGAVNGRGSSSSRQDDAAGPTVAAAALCGAADRDAENAAADAQACTNGLQSGGGQPERVPFHVLVSSSTHAPHKHSSALITSKHNSSALTTNKHSTAHGLNKHSNALHKHSSAPATNKRSNTLPAVLQRSSGAGKKGEKGGLIGVSKSVSGGVSKSVSGGGSMQHGGLGVSKGGEKAKLIGAGYALQSGGLSKGGARVSGLIIKKSERQQQQLRVPVNGESVGASVGKECRREERDETAEGMLAEQGHEQSENAQPPSKKQRAGGPSALCQLLQGSDKQASAAAHGEQPTTAAAQVLDVKTAQQQQQQFNSVQHRYRSFLHHQQQAKSGGVDAAVAHNTHAADAPGAAAHDTHAAHDTEAAVDTIPPISSDEEGCPQMQCPVSPQDFVLSETTEEQDQENLPPLPTNLFSSYQHHSNPQAGHKQQPHPLDQHPKPLQQLLSTHPLQHSNLQAEQQQQQQQQPHTRTLPAVSLIPQPLRDVSNTLKPRPALSALGLRRSGVSSGSQGDGMNCSQHSHQTSSAEPPLHTLPPLIDHHNPRPSITSAPAPSLFHAHHHHNQLLHAHAEHPHTLAQPVGVTGGAVPLHELEGAVQMGAEGAVHMRDAGAAHLPHRLGDSSSSGGLNGLNEEGLNGGSDGLHQPGGGGGSALLSDSSLELERRLFGQGSSPEAITVVTSDEEEERALFGLGQTERQPSQRRSLFGSLSASQRKRRRSLGVDVGGEGGTAAQLVFGECAVPSQQWQQQEQQFGVAEVSEQQTEEEQQAAGGRTSSGSDAFYSLKHIPQFGELAAQAIDHLMGEGEAGGARRESLFEQQEGLGAAEFGAGDRQGAGAVEARADWLGEGVRNEPLCEHLFGSAGAGSEGEGIQGQARPLLPSPSHNRSLHHHQHQRTPATAARQRAAAQQAAQQTAAAANSVHSDGLDNACPEQQLFLDQSERQQQQQQRGILLPPTTLLPPNLHKHRRHSDPVPRVPSQTIDHFLKQQQVQQQPHPQTQPPNKRVQVSRRLTSDLQHNPFAGLCLQTPPPPAKQQQQQQQQQQAGTSNCKLGSAPAQGLKSTKGGGVGKGKAKSAQKPAAATAARPSLFVAHQFTGGDGGAHASQQQQVQQPITKQRAGPLDRFRMSQCR